MKGNIANLLISVVLMSLSHASLAAPGTPIGGIIVKGGKNPGGQMHVLATTDSGGKFKIEFVEGGDYTLAFEARSRKDSGARVKAGMQLDYVIRTHDEIATDAKQNGATMSRPTPVHGKVVDAQMVVSVPKGGGEIRGVLQAQDAAEIDHADERAINESGVSVKSPTPTKPKGGIKH